MSQKARRASALFVTFLSLSLPLAAQPGLPQARGAAPDFFAVLWSRLTAPFSALWDRDTESAPDGTEATPNPDSTPPPVTQDGRSVIDPLG